MILPAWPTMPDFTAADPIVMSAFSPTALAGLGCGCSMLDDSGNCSDPDPCTTSGGSICDLSSDPSGCLSTYGGTDTVGTLSIGGTTSTGTTGSSDDLQAALNQLNSSSGCSPNAGGGFSCGSGSNAVDIPASTAAAYANFPSTTGSYRTDASGNIIVPMANGQGYYTVTPQGQLTQTTAASLPTTATGSYNPGLSTTQQSQLIAQAINQAATVGKILALQPGQSLLANGTVVGTGVSASSLLSSSSSSSILLLGAGLLVLMLVLGSEK